MSQARTSPAGAGTDSAAQDPHGRASGPEQRTRARVARLILENGPVSAAALGAALGLTPAAVRRHLDHLLAAGMTETRLARVYGNRGRGRPARTFTITDAGRRTFEHAYDDLATSALRFLAERAGPGAVAEFARRQVSDLERRYLPVVAAAPQAGRVRALAEALSADGYAATASIVSASPVSASTATASPGSASIVSASTATASRGVVAAGEQLCQHHCPVAHVAAEYPQLCEAETEAFARLLGTPVQRLATIAHGDGVCTTHVTAPSLRGAGPGGRPPWTPRSAVGARHSAATTTATTTTEFGGLSA